ncbi:MAG: LamG-like jellyroll fold domain-containing protein [Bacteroidota bacterium]
MKKLTLFVLTVGFCLGARAQHTLASYSFDGDAADLSQNGNDGTLFGPTVTANRFDEADKAYSFDGSSYIDFGNDASLDLQDGFSISAWVNRTGGDAIQTIAGRGYGNDGDYWLGLIDNGGSSNVRVWLDGEVFNGTASVGGGWNHIALTTETGTDGVKIYINGQLTDSFTSTRDLVGSSTFNLRAGMDDQDEDYFLTGRMDELSIYQKTLLPEEVLIQFNSTPLNFTINKADFGNALNFGDETSSWVSVPADGITGLTSFSMECWVNYRGTRDGNGFSNGYRDGNIAYFSFTGGEKDQLVTFNVNNFFFQVGTDAGFQTYELVNPTDVADSTWHHLAVTIDQATTTARYYVDGVETVSFASVSAFFEDFGFLEAFHLGRDWTISNYFGGTLDEIRVWNYALSPDEINGRKNIPLNGSESGLVYYFDFNQGEGNQTNSGLNTLVDRANGQDGEMFGFSLSGDDSNWVRNDFRQDVVSPSINRIQPTVAIPGKELTILGKNFHPYTEYNKVLIGSAEAEILSATTNAMKIMVPSGAVGNQKLIALTSSGSSNEMDFLRTRNDTQDFSFTRKPVSTSILGATDVRAADINNDGYQDLVVASLVPTEPIQIFYNTSSFDLANGTSNQVPFEITSTTTGHQWLFIEDIDGDGSQDILAHRFDTSVDWFRNGDFTESTITTEAINAIYPGDLDNDGDVDIVASAVPSDDVLVWYENDGNGNFPTNPDTIARGDLLMFIEGQSAGLSLEDLDGDFDLDIVLASNNDRDAPPTSIGAHIFINEGKGNFTQKVILQNVPLLGLDWRPTTGDFNGDGLIDIAHGGAFNAPIILLNDAQTDFTQNQLVTAPGIFTNGINSTDLDGDGDLDLLYLRISPLTDSTVWWARNDGVVNGQIAFESIKIESNLVASDSHIRYADMDNDGDVDVITASSFDNQVTVYNHSFAGNDFTSFSLLEEVTPSIIDTEAHTIDVVVDNTVALFRLIPEFSVSENASVTLAGETQSSGASVVDFRQSATYQIVAENGATQEWVVTVNALPQAPLARDASSVRTNSFNANWDAGIGNEYFLVEVADNIDFTNSFTLDTVRDASSAEVSGLVDRRSYWFRVKAGNQWGISEFSNTIFVEQPLTISDVTFDNYLSESAVEDTNVTFKVSGGRNVHEVFAFTRGVLEETFQDVSVDFDGETYSFPVTLSDLDAIGLEFDIEVTDNFNTIFTDRFFIYREDIEENLPFTAFGGSAGDWQIFSIPYELEDDLIESVFSELGTSTYKKDWRLVRYEDGQFIDFREGLNRIERGKGYWFNSAQEVSIGINGRIDPAITFDIRLTQGWNQIGNPYNVPLSWNSIRTGNSFVNIVGPALVYDANSQQFNEGDVLNPFQGAFVWSDEDVIVNVILKDDFRNGRIAIDEISGFNLDEGQWILDLNIGGGTHVASVGMHPNASVSKDQYDQMQIPKFANPLEMYTLKEDYFYPKFKVDILPTNSNARWLYTLSANDPLGWTELNWDNAEFQQSVAQLWLIDEVQGTVVNLADQSSYSFNHQGDHQFSIHLTENRQVLPTPTRMILSDPYPNPVLGESNISLSLPLAGDVELALYDLQGKRVITVTNGTLQAGVHQFKLDEQALLDLDDGVYFYRLETAEDIEPLYKKIIIKKDKR